MSRLLEIVVVLAIIGCAYSANTKRQQTAIRIAKVTCAPNVPADKAKIIKTCESKVPVLIRNNYNACVKEVLDQDNLTQPLICYKSLPNPNADKMKKCIENKAQSEAKKRPDLDFAKLKEKFLTLYVNCLAKIL